MYKGIDHLAIVAKNTTALAQWYCDHLGFAVTFDNEQTPPTLFIKGETGSAIEIMPAQARANETPPVKADFWDAGIRHIAIITTDFDESMATLTKIGAELVGPERVPIGGGRLQSFRDPEGNIAQVLWRP